MKAIKVYAVVCKDGTIHQERMGICGPKCRHEHPHIFVRKDSFDRSAYEAAAWKLFHDCAPHRVVKLVPESSRVAAGKRK